MPNALFPKRPLRDSVPKMAPKWIPRWLHFQLVSALVFDPFFNPPPNLLFAQTDPPRGAQGTNKAKKGPQNGAKMGPKHYDVAPFLHSWGRLVPQRPPETPKTSFPSIWGPFFPPKLHFYRSLTLSFARQGPKHRQEQPRTAKNLPKHKTHNDTPHQNSLIEEPRQPPRNAEPEFGGRRWHAAWRLRLNIQLQVLKERLLYNLLISRALTK